MAVPEVQEVPPYLDPENYESSEDWNSTMRAYNDYMRSGQSDPFQPDEGFVTPQEVSQEQAAEGLAAPAPQGPTERADSYIRNFFRDYPEEYIQEAALKYDQDKAA